MVEGFLQDEIPMETQAEVEVHQVVVKYLHCVEVVVQKNSQWKDNIQPLGYHSSDEKG